MAVVNFFQVFNMKIQSSAVLFAALLTSCAQTTVPTEVTSFNSPVEENTGITNTHYHGIVGEYNHRVPVDPKSWRKLNEDQTPKENQTQHGGES
jgi:hypothetical protein